MSDIKNIGDHEKYTQFDSAYQDFMTEICTTCEKYQETLTDHDIIGALYISTHVYLQNIIQDCIEIDVDRSEEHTSELQSH